MGYLVNETVQVMNKDGFMSVEVKGKNVVFELIIKDWI